MANKEHLDFNCDLEDYRTWLIKGLSLLDETGDNKIEEAIECFDKAIELNSNNKYALIDAWFNKGLLLNKLKKFEEALACLNNVTELDQNRGDAWFHKGYTLFELCEFEESIKCFDKAIELKENAWIHKGLALDNLGRFREALNCFDKAIKINQNNQYAWFDKGRTLAEIGCFEEATLSFDKAIELDPDDEDAWAGKGVVLERLARTEEANKCYEKSRDIKNKKTVNAHRYLIMSGRNSVEVWSEKRLPFEPKGSLQLLRNDIRSALGTINCGPTEVLHALYVSSINEACDVDNILFYNVGTEYFPQIGYAGLRFERSFSQPPPLPQTKEYSLQHYLRYWRMPKERSFECWIPTKKLVSWESRIPVDAMVKLKKSKNPAYVWFSIKSGSIEVLSESQDVPLQFGLRLSIRVPNSITSSFIDLLKPLLDGTVTAFHRHDGKAQALVAERLTTVLEVRAQDVLSFLSESTNAVLGTRTLLWIRGDGVQWNPADDCCVAGELLFESSSEDFVEFSGELFEVKEKKKYAVDINSYSSNELSKRYPNRGKFTKKDMQFCEAVLKCFDSGEIMWVIITKVLEDGVEGWIDNSPMMQGSPRYGEHVFARYEEIYDIA